MRAYLTLALMLSIGLPATAAPTVGALPNSETLDNPVPPPNRDAINREVIVPDFRSRMAFVREVRDLTKWDFALTLENPDWVLAQVQSPAEITMWKAAPETYKSAIANKDARVGVTLEKINLGTFDGLAAGTPVVWVKTGPYKIMTRLNSEPEDGKQRPQLYGNYFFDSWAGVAGNGQYAIGGWGGFDPELGELYSPFTPAPRYSETHAFTSNLVIFSFPQAERRVSVNGNKITLDMVGYEEKNNVFLKKLREEQAYLIPRESAGHLLAAKSFYAENGTLFGAKDATTNRARLSELLESDNPFLFAAAVRTLSGAGLIESEFVAKRLLDMDRLKQGVFVFSVLLNSSEAEDKVLVEVMQKAIGEAKNSAQLEGVFAGTLCAAKSHRMVRYALLGSMRRSLNFRPLRDTLTEKLKAFPVRDKTGQYMLDVLTRPEFRSFFGNHLDVSESAGASSAVESTPANLICAL